MKQPKVSIIIRTYNEEKWIGPCLDAIFEQTYKNFEVIIVDNKSKDKSVEKAKSYPIAKVVTIDKYLPGKSLNIGIEASDGDIIAMISAHCIPVNELWLEKLVENFDEKGEVAGVYGRQEPMSFTSDTDKRDLLTIFGLDKKIQKKDSYFHNANSVILRSLWEEVPFDDEITNIEDRIWAREMIKRGKTLIYEPEASVYHWHGVHQNQNPERCRNVVRILESLNHEDGHDIKGLNLNKLNIVALIPSKGEALKLGDRHLIEYTIEAAKKSKYIKKIVVTTDNDSVAKISKDAGAEVPFMRGKELSKDFIDLENVYKFTLAKLEESNIFPDLVITLEPTYPFREETLIDKLIEKLANEGLDSIISAKPTYSSCWQIDEDESYQRLDKGFIPRKFKEPIYRGMESLACVTYPHFIREGQLLGNKVGIMEIENQYSLFEIRTKEDCDKAQLIANHWFK